jgi:hypothetical protein
MNVRELKELLEQFDDDLEVVLSKDEEGNSFAPLSEGYTLGFFFPDEGDFVSDRDTEEDDEINTDGASESVCLWPEY